MPRVRDIIDLVREFAPEQNTAHGYSDNVGLILGRENAHVKKVLCCLDATAAVIDEASRIGAELIISHHPFIYGTALKRITDESVVGQKLLFAAENKIAVYSAHTNLDIASGGINDYAAELMGLYDYCNLDNDNERELGRIGELDEPMGLKELAAKATEVFGNVRIIAREEMTIDKIAIINGGGGGNADYLLMARQQGAQAFITSDVKYHVALLAAELGMAIIEPTHYAMEQIYISRFVEILKDSASRAGLNVEFLQSNAEKSPYLA